MNQQQAPSVARIVRPSRATIQWNDPLDVALAHMNATFHDELFVLTGDRLIGRHGSRIHAMRDGHERERGPSVDGDRGCEAAARG